MGLTPPPKIFCPDLLVLSPLRSFRLFPYFDLCPPFPLRSFPPFPPKTCSSLPPFPPKILSLISPLTRGQLKGKRGELIFRGGGEKTLGEKWGEDLTGGEREIDLWGETGLQSEALKWGFGVSAIRALRSEAICGLFSDFRQTSR